MTTDNNNEPASVFFPQHTSEPIMDNMVATVKWTTKDGKTYTANTYVGAHAGKDIQECIKRAQKEILILTPYMGGAQLIFLLENAKKGVKVRVGFSELILKKNDSLRTILKFFTMFDLEAGYDIAFYCFADHKNRSKGLVHAKMYVIDEVCFLGSLNFSNGGLIDNVEVCTKFNSPSFTGKIKKFILNSFKADSGKYTKVNIGEYVKKTENEQPKKENEQSKLS